MLLLLVRDESGSDEQPEAAPVRLCLPHSRLRLSEPTRGSGVESIRLMMWCRTCLSGLHLPAFAAAEGGLFADRGIEIEFVNCVHAADFSLRGFATRPRAVAAGMADFALTSVAYVLAAQTAAGGHLPVRFAAVCHQRSPLCGIVRGTDASSSTYLGGRRTARWRMPWFAQEYIGALEHLDIRAAAIVDMAEHSEGTLARVGGALGRGDIDVIPTWIDMAFHHDDVGFSIRAIPLDIAVYTTGLVAADRLAPQVISAVRDAYVAGYYLQVEQPELGIAGLRRRFPDVSEAHLIASWSRFAPYAFDTVAPGTMDARRWEETIAYTARTHGLSVLPGDRLYRPELLTPPSELSPAIGEAPLAPVYQLRTRSSDSLPV